MYTVLLKLKLNEFVNHGRQSSYFGTKLRKIYLLWDSEGFLQYRF